MATAVFSINQVGREGQKDQGVALHREIGDSGSCPACFDEHRYDPVVVTAGRERSEAATEREGLPGPRR